MSRLSLSRSSALSSATMMHLPMLRGQNSEMEVNMSGSRGAELWKVRTIRSTLPGHRDCRAASTCSYCAA